MNDFTECPKCHHAIKYETMVHERLKPLHTWECTNCNWDTVRIFTDEEVNK